MRAVKFEFEIQQNANTLFKAAIDEEQNFFRKK